MSALNLSNAEIIARMVTVPVSLSATDAALAIAAARTGLVPVLVMERLTATGTYTVAYESPAATAITGADTINAGGTLEKEVGQTLVKGASGSALVMNATKSSGNLTGYVGYIYISA